MIHSAKMHDPSFEAADPDTLKPFGASEWTCKRMNRAMDEWWERNHPGQNRKHKHSAFRKNSDKWQRVQVGQNTKNKGAAFKLKK